MQFLDKKTIDKKLCIHCKYCVGYEKPYMCGKFRDLVSDAPKYSCIEVRTNKCYEKGKFWELSEEIQVFDTTEEARKKEDKYQMDSYKERAHEIFTKDLKSYIANGYIERWLEIFRNEEKK